MPPETQSWSSEVERIREQVARIMGRAPASGSGGPITLADPIERGLRRRAKRQGLLLMAVSAVITMVLMYAVFNALARAL